MLEQDCEEWWMLVLIERRVQALHGTEGIENMLVILIGCLCRGGWMSFDNVSAAPSSSLALLNLVHIPHDFVP